MSRPEPDHDVSFEVAPHDPLVMADLLRRRALEGVASSLGALEGLRARLDKSRKYVLCGRVECGARFATVTRFTERDFDRAQKRMQRTGIWVNMIDHIRFLRGWAPDRTTEHVRDGIDLIWRFSTSARRKVRAGRKPALRRYPERRGLLTENDAMDPSFFSLPTQAICSTCHHENVIVSEVVGVGLVLILV